MEAIAGPRYLAVAPCSRERNVRLRSAFPAAPCRRVRSLIGHQQHSAAPLGPSSTTQTPPTTSLVFSLSFFPKTRKQHTQPSEETTHSTYPATHTRLLALTAVHFSPLLSTHLHALAHTHTPCPWPDTTAPGTSIWFGNGMAWF